MGILNRTPDSFYDQGATFELDSLLQRAEVLVQHGADILDVGGVKAGPGPEVDEAEELDRIVAPIAAVHERFDVAISCDTWRASVLDEACKAGAVVGNDISGFATPTTSTWRQSRCIGGRYPHPVTAARCRSRASLRRPARRRHRLPARLRRARRSRRPRTDQIAPTLASTSARRRRRARCCCARATRWRATATCCSCRRRQAVPR